MKIQCNACEAAEAKVLCCADEAALCLACDERVHAANKLAGKHQRVPLTGSSSQVPKCDICKEASGYFFCLEDRALLCRKCDVAIHTANSFVSAHQRFLLTGVKVGSETSENVISLAEQQPVPFNGNTESSSKSLHDKKSSSMSLSAKNSQVVSNNTGNNGGLHASKVSCPPIMTGGAPEWPPEDFFDFANFGQSYGYIEHESSKADSGKVGSLEGSPVYASAGEELGIEFVGQVPEIPWTVPEIPSPPTASGLNWPKYSDRSLVEDSAYVPDISSSYSDMQWGHYSSTFPKRRRRS